VGYALGQCLATQFWLDTYKPRNMVPWALILVRYLLYRPSRYSYIIQTFMVISVVLVLIIRHLLLKENLLRDKMREEGQVQREYGYVERLDVDGKQVKQQVDIALLDITDRQNLAFRYPL